MMNKGTTAGFIYKSANILYIMLMAGVILMVINRHVFDSDHKLLTLCVLAASGFIIWALKRWRFDWKHIKPALLACIAAGILVRIGLLFIGYKEPITDYLRFYNCAVTFSRGLPFDAPLMDNNYLSALPHVCGYIYVLGTCMKAFGTSYYVAVGLNVFFDVSSICFAYQFLKIVYNERAALVGAFLWAANPMAIIWIIYPFPGTLFNSLSFISLFFLALLHQSMMRNDRRRFWIYSSLTGLCLGMANIFRPVAIIYIIAIAIYYIHTMLADGTRLDRRLLAAGLILLCITYTLPGRVFDIYTEKRLGYQLSGVRYGWNLYVGSNLRSEGGWSIDDAWVFSRELYSTDYTPVKFHAAFRSLALERYRNNGLWNNIVLFYKKAESMLSGMSYYSEYNFRFGVRHHFPKIEQYTIKAATSLFYFLLIILNILSGFTFLKRKELICMMPLYLFVLGIIVAHLPMEAMPRYMLPVFVPMVIMAGVSLHALLVKDTHGVQSDPASPLCSAAA